MKTHMRYPILISLSAICIFLLVLLATSPYRSHKEQLYATNSDVLYSEAENVSAPIHKYVATIWNDSLVIFNTGDMTHPEYISDISIYSLTKTDLEILKDGIYLDTKEDISRLLEDLES